MAVGSKSKSSGFGLGSLVDRMIKQNGAMIIKRPGRRDLALIPAEKLREVDTAAYLLSSPRNRRRLLSALRDARAGKGKPMTVEQLRKHVGLDE